MYIYKFTNFPVNAIVIVRLPHPRIYIYIYIYIYVIMKRMCPPGYHHNGFVATHALGHMMYGSVRFEHSVCRGSLMTTIYIYISLHL